MKLFQDFEQDSASFEVTLEQIRGSASSEIESLQSQVEDCLLRVHETVMTKV